MIDTIHYGMVKAIGREGIQAYITYTTEEEKDALPTGVKGIRLPPFRGKFNWATIRTLRQIIRTYHIDVIYGINSSDLSNALFASWGTQTKIVGYRGTQAKIRRSDLTYYLGILNPRVDHIICNTEDIKNQLSRFISTGKMTVNSKPYDVAWMADALTHPKRVGNIPNDAFQVICIANTRKRPFKGLRVLIQGMHLTQNPKIHLIHIGTYDDADYQLAQQGKAASRIHMLGLHKDAIHFLPETDVCICPSTRDASPRSLREAMACKIACIVTDIPGARELVRHKETGLIIPAGSPEAIAQSIEMLAKHPEMVKIFGEAGYQRLVTHYTMDKYVNKFIEVFRQVSQ